MDAYQYVYGFGGIVFGVGLYYAWRQGYVGLKGKAVTALLITVFGLGFFAVLQAWLQYGTMTETPAKAYDGSYVPQKTVGTALDYGIMVAYFVVILAIGTWFGRQQKSTRDFFFGGQRFAWWLITFSLIATTIGSYSFVKYSRIAYTYGIASSQTYFNDWFWFPLLAFGWLPILYFSRIVSIPEYFERRFDRRARNIVTWLLLLYLVGYVGVNLLTMGKALNILLGWPIPMAAMLVATVSAIYVTAGGQTSVIMTDLFQGVMLLATGLVLIVLGAEYLGGLDALWENLPRGHRLAFANYNEDPAYNSVGIFWQDAMANSAMFFFLNQGMAMRFMAARSVGDARKALTAALIVLFPVAAVVVASGGWVGRALVNAGVLPPDIDPARVFFVTSELLSHPGVFGLIMAALTAALMSTVDTLITAVAAVVVNDLYRPNRPKATETELLRVARYTSVGVAILGVALVPVFMMFESIYAAHGAFTAAVTPPLVVALLFGVFWRRYSATAAFWTMAGGTAAIILSVLIPELVAPFSQGVPAGDPGEGIFAGAKQYKYTRALFGLSVSATIGVVVGLLTRGRPLEELRGLVWGTVKDAIEHYKGAPGTETEGPWASALPRLGDEDRTQGDANIPLARISKPLAESLGGAVPGDLLYVSDSRRWLGGLRSGHVLVSKVLDDPNKPAIELGPMMHSTIIVPRRRDEALRVRKLY